ncbi:EAL domain-containing protein [Rhizobium sp.]|uniref:bifunctional diguanylate cyclase/phosphodiesterase n=1 Tax=Rhizobium sp. TaxID=391 RepID=UPI002AA6402A
MEKAHLEKIHFSNKQVLKMLAGVLILLFGMLTYLYHLNTDENIKHSRIFAQDQLERVDALVSLHINRALTTLSHVANATPDSNALTVGEVDRVNKSILKTEPQFLSIAITRGDENEVKWTRTSADTVRVQTEATATSVADISGIHVLPGGKLQLDISSPAQPARPRITVRAVVDASVLLEPALKRNLEVYADDASRPPTIELTAIARAKGVDDVVFGSNLASLNKPENKTIAFADGTLEILAYPKNGWESGAPGAPDIGATLVAVGLIFTTLFSSIALLLIERNGHRQNIQTAEERHRLLAKRFELAMDTSNIGIWEMEDASAAIRHDNRAAQLHGVKAIHAQAHDFSSWLIAVHPNDRSKVEQHLVKSRESDTASVEEYRIILQDGTIRHVRSVGAYSNQTKPGRVTGILLDITADIAMQTDLRAAKESSDIKNAELELALDELSIREHQLEDLSERFELALDSYNCGVWQHDFSTGRTVWDHRMCHLYNIPPTSGNISEALWLKNVHPGDVSVILAAASAAAEDGKPLSTTHRVVLDNGAIRYVRNIGQLRIDRNGGRKLSGVSFDVTADVLLTEELRQAKAEAEARNIELELTKNRIEYNALHDPLTGLANRRKFDRELDMLTLLGKAGRARFTILHLDLDRFKEINDTLGHAAGDAMLVNAAKVLERHVRSPDLVARIGGDEFVVLLRDVVDHKLAADLAARIIKEINIPFDFEGFSCRFGVSIGIAEANGIKTDARKILIDADLALYEAKRKGRNCYEFFTQSLQANIVTSRRVADELLTALERDEITAWYQPQFCANTMELVGAEALVRWQHPEQGILPTSRFLKVAEDLSVMAQLDKIVLDCALRDRMRWTAMGIAVPKISVNVSSKRLHDANLVESLQGLSITPGTMAFELVESIFLDENDDTVTSNIEKIKALGIDVEIDDFGTGHTSIISLLKIQPKRLKIDRQLVMPILNSNRERALVRSIIEIARSLGVGTIAEGVETQAHADILRDMGCDRLQGYAFSHALSFQEFATFALSRDKRQAS